MAFFMHIRLKNGITTEKKYWMWSKKLGWTIADEKSDGINMGSTCKKYLGFLLDTERMVIYLQWKDWKSKKINLFSFANARGQYKRIS